MSMAFVIIASTAMADEWDQVMVYFNKKDAIPARTNANNKGYYAWAKCWDDKFDNQPVGPDDVKGLPAPCRPDTLYSWGGLHKLGDLEKEAGEGKPWSDRFSTNIFTHINPVATFGYGTHAFRFKLKSSTKFLLVSSSDDEVANNGLCRKFLSAEAQKDTVLVRAWNLNGLTGVDYIMCSPKVLHSWSMDTRTHYDEVVASLSWNDKYAAGNGSNDWIPYVYSNGTAELFDTSLDSLDWSADTLLKDMQTMRRFAAAGKDKLVFAPGVAKNEADHFSTTHPIYWNHR